MTRGLFIALLGPALAAAEIPGAIRVAAGLTREGAPIEGLITADDLDYHTLKTRVLVIGDAAPFEWFYGSKDAARLRRHFAVPVLEYQGALGPETTHVWRWMGMHAPDWVVDARSAASDELLAALGREAPAGTGTIPALRSSEPLATVLPKLHRAPSAARAEIRRRLARSPIEIARQLSVRYGHELEQVVYIPAFALIGRLRMGEVADVERIVRPYFTGEKDALAKPTSSHLSGHLIFAELARITGRPRYLELARAAADLGFDEQGRPKQSMPFHNEMSDSFFMGCPILAQVGKLTGEEKYFDMCLRHMRFMSKLDLRPDGLYRHSPLNAAAWGRGNAFPALGLALSLAALPEKHAGRAEMLEVFQAHMAALARHQDANGMWHQVVDVPGSYPELSATCMIAYAMRRGVRAGWLERGRYEPLIRRAWEGIRARIAPDGSLVDVCVSTGKQKRLEDYLERTAILGPDPRGGAMALLIATEMAGLP